MIDLRWLRSSVFYSKFEVQALQVEEMLMQLLFHCEIDISYSQSTLRLSSIYDLMTGKRSAE